MIEEFDEDFADGLCYIGGEDFEGSYLDWLQRNRIFQLQRRGDDFILIEACDDYFAVDISKDQLKNIIKELQELLDD
jgi:hypothetical protein